MHTKSRLFHFGRVLIETKEQKHSNHNHERLKIPLGLPTLIICFDQDRQPSTHSLYKAQTSQHRALSIKIIEEKNVKAKTKKFMQLSKIEEGPLGLLWLAAFKAMLLMDDDVMKIEEQAIDCPSLLATPAPTSHPMQYIMHRIACHPTPNPSIFMQVAKWKHTASSYKHSPH